MAVLNDSSCHGSAPYTKVGRTSRSIWFMTPRLTFMLGVRYPVNGFSFLPMLDTVTMIVSLTSGGGVLQMTSGVRRNVTSGSANGNTLAHLLASRCQTLRSFTPK